MDIEVGDHAALDEPVSDEVAGQLDPLLLGHLPRDRELDFASKLGILADLRSLDVVPEFFAVAPLLGRTVWQQHLAVRDPRLVRAIMAAAEALIVQPVGRTIGRRRDRAADDGTGKIRRAACRASVGTYV